MRKLVLALLGVILVSASFLVPNNIVSAVTVDVREQTVVDSWANFDYGDDEFGIGQKLSFTTNVTLTKMALYLKKTVTIDENNFGSFYYRVEDLSHNQIGMSIGWTASELNTAVISSSGQWIEANFVNPIVVSANTIIRIYASQDTAYTTDAIYAGYSSGDVATNEYMQTLDGAYTYTDYSSRDLAYILYYTGTIPGTSYVTTLGTNPWEVLSSEAILNGSWANNASVNASILGFQIGTFSGIYTSNITVSGNYNSIYYNLTSSNLTPNIDYFYRAEAYDGTRWYYGQELQFFTQETYPPTVVAISASLTFGNTLFFTSHIDSNVNVIDAGFIYGIGTDSTLWIYSSVPETMASNFTSGNVYRLGSGLPNGTYYFKAWALNSYGITYSAIKQFIISGSTVVFNVDTIQNNGSVVVNNSVTLSGIISNVNNDVWERDFRWRKVTDTTWSSWSAPTPQSYNGTFYYQVFNLSVNSTYEWQSGFRYSNNGVVTWTIDIPQFATGGTDIGLGSVPTLRIENYYNLINTGVTVNATMIHSDSAVFAYGFQYRLVYGNQIWLQKGLSGTLSDNQSFIGILTSFPEGSYIEVRPFATSSFGESNSPSALIQLSGVHVIPTPIPTTTPGGGNGGGTNVPGDYSDILRSQMRSLNMDNPTGHWAYMFLWIVGLSIIFGMLTIMLVFKKENLLAQIVGFIWIIIILIIVGIFAWSGLLGWWPIIILVLLAVAGVGLLTSIFLNKGQVQE